MIAYLDGMVPELSEEAFNQRQILQARFSGPLWVNSGS